MEFSATTPSPLSSMTTGKVSFIIISFCSWLMTHNSTASNSPGLFPPATPAPLTPNESLQLVGGSLSPSTCDASHIEPQRVITTRWGLSLSLHLRRQPHRPPMSHCDLLGALPPLPPAMPATPTPNESLRLVGGSLSPSTCDTSHINPQRVILTRWGLSLPLHLRRQPHQPPMSHCDSLGAQLATAYTCQGHRRSIVSCS